MRVRRHLALACACAAVLAAPPVTPVATALDTAPPFVLAWGSPGTGTGQFSYMDGVAVDLAGNVYVVDSGNHRVQKFTATGTFIAQWGGEGTADGTFSFPSGIAVAPNGNLHVVDNGNDRVQTFTANGSWVRTWGETGTGNGQFSAPNGVAVDPTGNVYVVDSGNSRVQKFSSSGGFLTSWGGPGGTNGLFHAPVGIAVDGAGDVYVGDAMDRVQVFSSTGGFKRSFGVNGSGDGQLWSPWGIAVDASNRVYVVDLGNDRVQAFTTSGTFVTAWGVRGTANGQFRQPRWVAVDGAGAVFVVDAQNYRVQKFGGSTGPIVTITRPANGATYAQGRDVMASYVCSPAGGVAITSCVGTVANGAPVDTSSLGSHQFTVTATDAASRSTGVTTTYTVVDVTDPTITIVRPPDDSVYARGAAVTASYRCQDESEGSGLESCVGTVRNGSPVDTRTVGSHRFSVTAADRAGNEVRLTHQYTVAIARPDTRIEATAGGALVGNDVYSTGTGQRVDRLARPGRSTTYVVSVQNDALFPDRMRIEGDGAGRSYVVRYVDSAGTDITADVEAGRYLTRRLPPGGAAEVRISVDTRSSAPTGSNVGVVLTASSTTHAAVSDTVKAVTHSTSDTAAPTVVIRQPGDGSVIPRGRDINADYSCTDPGGWGVSTCTGTVADGRPIDTDTLGEQNVRVTATDWAGHKKTETAGYTVALARPDGLVRCIGGRPCTVSPVLGDDVYNSDGSQQTIRPRCFRDDERRLPMFAQNDAAFADVLTITGQPSASGFTLRYLDSSGMDITTAVTAGTFRTPRLSPGELFRFEIGLKCRASVEPDTTLRRSVVVGSSTHPARTDTLVVVATGPYS